jgi:transcriptional regulator with XRE-family HTH domain
LSVSYTEEVGESLRRIRVERGLSLQDVERMSDGHWKAAVVGSYERGDRNISATRLLELAEYYDVSPSEVLPGEPAIRRDNASTGVVIDLQKLELLGERWAPVRRYLESIQVQRGDFNRQMLSIRGEDLRALSVMHDGSPDELITELRAAGAIIEH